MRWIVLVGVALAASVASGNELRLEAGTEPPQAGISGSVLIRDAEGGSSVRLSWASEPTQAVTLEGRSTRADTWWFEVPQERATAREGTVGLSEFLGRVGREAAREAEPKGVTTARLNLRDGPGLSHAVIETVDPGTELLLSGERDGAWVQLTRGERTLWAHSNYVLASGENGGSRSLEIARRDAHSYTATLRDGSQLLARQVLTRAAQRVLLVNVGGDAIKDGVAMRRSLDPLERYYRDQGYEVLRHGSDTARDLVELLASEQERPFSRVVFAAHSGWDGPIWVQGVQQLLTFSDGFSTFAEQLGRSTTTDAKVYVSGCHAAGSNKYEPASNKIWVRDLSRASGRTVGGPTGFTNAAEHTYRQTLAVIEGEGRVVQESVLVTGNELKRWGGGVTTVVTPVAPLPPEPMSEEARFLEEDDAEAEVEAEAQPGLINEVSTSLRRLFELDFGFGD